MWNRGRSSLVSSARTDYIYDDGEILCKCKRLAPRETSWSDANPGRRYYCCTDFKVRGKGCGFFWWYDPNMCSRAKSLLREFRDSEKLLATENEALRRLIRNEMGSNRNEEYRSSVQSSHGEEITSFEGRDLNEQLVKMKEEVDLMRKVNLKLKAEANAEKRAKRANKLLLIGSWFCMLCFFMGLLFGSSGKKSMLLP
ncbi:hypothetical protein PTKIN_Ptkin05aG0148200 [Pterospermum kingtungense]